MTRSQRRHASKAMSKFLRHAPQDIGLSLEEGGWVAVNDLLVALAEHADLALTRADLDEIVRENDKQRFTLSEDGSKIRAAQGHTTEVDLNLRPRVPPNTLFHGTALSAVEKIQDAGILKMRRHHVHLSADFATAVKVGKRHGRPAIFAVDAARMYADGIEFFCSDNGVWLVDRVPPTYITMKWEAEAT
jgi:putative RNA 2'-phosphotransferase